MKTSRRQTLLIVIALSLLVVAGLALAQNVPASQPLIPASQTQLENQPEMQTANYCQTCHSTGDPQLLDPTAWRGGIERTTIDSCPVVTRLHEEINYTERLLLAIDRARAELPDGPETASLDARLAAADQTYSRLLDAPVTSLDATVSEAQSLRFRLGKIYTLALQAIDEAKKERVLLFAGLVTLILLVSLGWGLYNTQKTARSAAPGRKMPFILSGIALALLVFAIFTLPLLQVPSQQTASASTDIATALDTAQRLADTAERADDRAWMFSRIAAAWNQLDPKKAEIVLKEALQAAQQAEQNTFALWGEAAYALEAAIGDPASLEKAGLIADQLNATRSRAWALRLIAGEWAGVDPQRAKEILEMAVSTAESGIGLNRDLDLRGIAVEMAKLDSQRGLEIARMVADPALRAWGLREIGALTKDPAIFAQAVEAARQIESPARRAEALRKIGQLTQDPALFQEAREALNGLEGPALAYALSDLAATSGDAALIQQIDPAYPEARSLALLHLDQHPQAWEESRAIQDPYEKGRAQASIVSAWTETDPEKALEAAQEIAIPTLRERAVADVIRITGDESLVDRLTIPYYRVQALTALGQYEAAWKEAEALKEAFPLVELGTAWAKTDPDAASAVVERIEREADKAAVLNILAAETQDPALFERALNMALAARVRNDALAPARTSLDLAQLFLGLPEDAQIALQQAAALQQAYEITQRIAIK